MVKQTTFQRAGSSFAARTGSTAHPHRPDDGYFFRGAFGLGLGAAKGEVATTACFDLSAFGFFFSRLLRF
jgi:hypothetical protein